MDSEYIKTFIIPCQKIDSLKKNIVYKGSNWSNIVDF